MSETIEAPKMLRGFRIWIPVLIGLGVSAFLLYSNLNEVRFVEVASNETGTHIWIDANENGEIEHWLEEEFKQDSNGTFRKESISDIVKSIEWSKQSTLFLILAVLMIFVRDLGYIIRIRLLTEKKLSWYRSFIVIMMWEFASALSPGVVGGAAVAMFILNREKIPMGRATALVVITAFLDNLFFVLCVPLIAILVGHAIMFDAFSSDVSSGLVHLFWTGYALIVFISVLLFLSLFYYPKLIKNVLMFLARLPFIRKYREGLLNTGDEIITTSKEFKNKKMSFWLSVFGATFLSWTGRYLVINMILAAFLSLNLYDHFIVLAKQFALWVIMLISPTPGASGVAEWGFTALLGDFASSALLISSLAVLWRLISYFPYLFIGSLLMPRWLKTKKKN
jgi:uncharacterized protein (TIRG00374 family)